MTLTPSLSERLAFFLADPQDNGEALLDALALIAQAEQSRAELSAHLALLERLAQATWWSCPCGPLSPALGLIDALCPSCGEFRQLGRRLARPLWPIFISFFKQWHADLWFSELIKRVQAQPEAASGRPPTRGVGGVWLLCSHSAEGENTPYLLAPDGMRLSAAGELSAQPWICYPFPTLS